MEPPGSACPRRVHRDAPKATRRVYPGGLTQARLGAPEAVFPFGNTGGKSCAAESGSGICVGVDTVSVTAKVDSFGSGSGLVRSGKLKFDDGSGITGWLNTERGYVTLRGSVARWAYGDNRCGVAVPEVPGALRVLLAHGEELGWYSLTWPLRVTLGRLDVCLDSHPESVSGWLLGAYNALPVTKSLKPSLYGRPPETVNLLRLRRGRRQSWVIAARFYDKDLQLGGERGDLLRCEVPVGPDRLRSLDQFHLNEDLVPVVDWVGHQLGKWGVGG